MKINITYRPEEEEKTRIIWRFARALCPYARINQRRINPPPERRNDAL